MEIDFTGITKELINAIASAGVRTLALARGRSRLWDVRRFVSAIVVVGFAFGAARGTRGQARAPAGLLVRRGVPGSGAWWWRGNCRMVV